MTEAVYTLIGIVVGAVLSGTVQLFVEWRLRKRRGKAAARLLYHDLFLARDLIEGSLESGKWWDENLPVADWLTYRDTLSDSIKPSSFFVVAGAFYGIGTLNSAEHDPEVYPRKSIEDGLLRVVKAASVIMDEALSFREVRRFVRDAAEGGEGVVLAIEPGDQCLAPPPDGADELVQAIRVGPFPPEGAAELGVEDRRVRVEVDGERYAVLEAALRPVSGS